MLWQTLQKFPCYECSTFVNNPRTFLSTCDRVEPQLSFGQKTSCSATYSKWLATTIDDNPRTHKKNGANCVNYMDKNGEYETPLEWRARILASFLFFLVPATKASCTINHEDDSPEDFMTLSSLGANVNHQRGYLLSFDRLKLMSTYLQSQKMARTILV